MAKQLINAGTVVNDGTGDTIRDAMVKVNNNINDIYSILGNGVTLDPHLQIGDVLQEIVFPIVPSTANGIPYYAANGNLTPTPGFVYDVSLNRLRFDSSGTTTTNSTLTLSDYAGAGIYMVEFGDQTTYPGITLSKRRGTRETQSSAISGDTLGVYSVDAGVFGSSYTGGSIKWVGSDSTIPGQINSILTLNAIVNDQLTAILQSDSTGNAVFNGIKFLDNTVQTSSAISLNELKSIVADSTDFADFQLRIAAL